MYLQRRLKNQNNFFQKIKDLDFSLLICILLLGFISLATMYSTDGGEALFHTKSHFSKFIIFTFLMLIVSFLNYLTASGSCDYLQVSPNLHLFMAKNLQTIVFFLAIDASCMKRHSLPNLQYPYAKNWQTLASA